MLRPKVPLFLAVVRWIVELFWWFSVAFLAVLAAWAVGGWLGVGPEGSVELEVPIAVPARADATAGLLGAASTQVWIQTTWLGGGVRLLIVVTTASSLVVTWQLLGFLRDVQAGRPFVKAMPRRMVVIGAMVIVAGLLQATVEYAVAGEAIRRLSLEPQGATAQFRYGPESVLLSLVLFVAAEVFRRGLRLQEESDLTV